MNAHLDVDLRFETERLEVDDWHIMVETHGLDLTAEVRALLTPSTTASLPVEWRGEYSVVRTQQWIDERDAESPTLLVVDRSTNQAIGLVILFFVAQPHGSGAFIVQIGYILCESVWGRGLGTELVSGLVTWARARPTIISLVAGVDPSHATSVRVLVKNGFARSETGSADEQTYHLDVVADDI